MTNFKAIETFTLEELEKLLVELNDQFEKNTNDSIALEEALSEKNKALVELAAEENEVLYYIRELKKTSIANFSSI